MMGKRTSGKEEKKKLKKEIMKVRNSRKVYLPFYFMILILAGVLAFAIYNGQPLNKAVLILVVVFIILCIKFTEVHRLTNLYSISPSSVKFSSGLVGKKVKNIDFFAISDIDVHQTLWQRIVGFGDVHVSLFADTSVIRNINDPVKFANFLEKMIDKRRGEADW